MSYLYVKPKKKHLVELPHYVLVNDQVLGLVKGQVVRIHLPAGSYKVTVRSVYKFIEGSAMVEVGDDETVTCMVSDHEKWWNILFNVDTVGRQAFCQHWRAMGYRLRGGEQWLFCNMVVTPVDHQKTLFQNRNP